LRNFFTRHFVSTIVAISYQNELTPLLAKEDCEARKFVKNETQCEAGVGQNKPKEDSEEGPVDGEDDEVDGEDDDENKDSDDDSDESTSTTIGGELTYAQRRERNIEENKKLLDELFPVRRPLAKELEAWTQKNKGCVL
jgi:hypothetical protein